MDSFTADCISAIAAFVPILEERKAEIEKIEYKTFVYNDKRRTRNEVRDLFQRPDAMLVILCLVSLAA